MRWNMMPVYEYLCEDCAERVEVLVRSGSNEAQCPNCGSILLKTLFSAPYVMSGK